MRTVTVCLGLVGVLSCSIVCAQEVKTPPEAAPVIAVLKAAKGSDTAGFKNAYSRPIREDQDQRHWENNLREAQVNLKILFGDYQTNDFSFTFSGDRKKGKVILFHKDQEAFPLTVIKEGKNWKVDER